MITVKKELDFQDMLNECWSGAIWTLELIEKYEKEEELLDFLNEIYGDEILSIADIIRTQNSRYKRIK